MRVVCDSCGASYRIPDHKLVKEVNKATCRKCGESIIIRRSAGMSVGEPAKNVDPEASTQVTEMSAIGGDSSRQDQQVASIPSGPSMGHGFGQPAHQLPEDAGPPTVAQQMDFKDETIPRQDLPERTAAKPGLQQGSPPLPRASTPASKPSPPPAPVPAAPKAPSAPPPAPGPARSAPSRGGSGHDPSGDLTVVMMSNFVCAAGALFIVAAQEDWHRLMGLFVCLAGAVLSLAILITSDRGKKSGAMVVSYIAAVAIAGGASFGLHIYENSSATVPQTLAQAPSVENVPSEEVVPDDALEEAGDSGELLEEDEEELEEEPEEEPVEASTAASPETASASTPLSGRGAFPTDSSGSSSSSRASAPPPVEDDWDDDWDDEPAPTRRSEPEPEPEPEPASEGVPLQVLDTMLRTNRGVKTCFVNYRNETGRMPSGKITVSMKIQSSGSASSVRIDGGEYAGTSLDGCLASAISGISFPPFSGAAKTYRYPFML